MGEAQNVPWLKGKHHLSLIVTSFPVPSSDTCKITTVEWSKSWSPDLFSDNCFIATSQPSQIQMQSVWLISRILKRWSKDSVHKIAMAVSNITVPLNWKPLLHLVTLSFGTIRPHQDASAPAAILGLNVKPSLKTLRSTSSSPCRDLREGFLTRPNTMLMRSLNTLPSIWEFRSAYTTGVSA